MSLCADNKVNSKSLILRFTSTVWCTGQQELSNCFLYTHISLKYVVLYGCETWSLTLREERKLRVFENMVLEENIWTEE